MERRTILKSLCGIVLPVSSAKASPPKKEPKTKSKTATLRSVITEGNHPFEANGIGLWFKDTQCKHRRIALEVSPGASPEDVGALLRHMAEACFDMESPFWVKGSNCLVGETINDKLKRKPA